VRPAAPIFDRPLRTSMSGPLWVETGSRRRTSEGLAAKLGRIGS